jgi:hypothetical protein
LTARLSQLRLGADLGFADNQPPLAEAYARLPRFTQVTNINRLGLVPLSSRRPTSNRRGSGNGRRALMSLPRVAFTHYDQRTEDLLLARQFTPSAGYASVLDNVGVLSNKSIELERNTPNIEQRSFAW